MIKKYTWHTWSGFKSVKPAPLLSRGFIHLAKLLEPIDEIAGQGFYCFLLRWHSLAFRLIRNVFYNFFKLKLIVFSFNTLMFSDIYAASCTSEAQTLLIITFSWRDCAGVLFVGYWITHCVPSLGCFMVSILCSIVPSIFCTIFCVIFQIYIII